MIRPRLSRIAFTVAIGLSAPAAGAETLRYSILAGYGQSAIQRDVLVDGEVQSVIRSEEPLAVRLGVEGLLSDQVAVGVYHSRGVRLGPISSGVSFTGIEGRWHFLSPVPFSVREAANDSQMVRQEWSPFIGVGLGVASASVFRELESVQTVSDSGIYFSGNLGVELALSPGLSARAELSYLMGSGSPSASSSIIGFHSVIGIVLTP